MTLQKPVELPQLLSRLDRAIVAADLIPPEAMPFNLIQDVELNASRIQAEHDRARQHEAAMQSAQTEMAFA